MGLPILDKFGGGWLRNINMPAEDGFAITPADDTDLPQVTRGIYVGTGGDLVVVTKLGTTLTHKNVPSGSFLPIRATQVSAATTAADLIGWV
jgi:hypothetical protein